LQRAAPALQQVEDGHAPPLVAGDPVRGGTHVIKLQSACPFRAYAELRLGAVPLDQPEIGLDAAERGALLHAVLEQVWDSVQSHARLCQLTPTQEATLVEQVVERVLAAPTTRRPHTYSARFTALEKARLQRLVREWLVLERERAPFEVVQPEAQRRIRIGGIELQTKIDRIDRLPDGELVIVDYKTGKADVAQWFGARPDEPQLPLYCIDLAADGGRVGGALFGQARLGDVRFKGLARTADLAPGVRALAQSKYAADYATWEALLATWQATLSRLATEFRDGRAAVDPKDYPKTCRYCHLTPLCRIHEVNARLGRMSLDASDLEGTVDG
jgi:probable DNA repair protein